MFIHVMLVQTHTLHWFSEHKAYTLLYTILFVLL